MSVSLSHSLSQTHKPQKFKHMKGNANTLGSQEKMPMRNASGLGEASGNSLSIPSAHQWRFHFLIPSSLQMRRRLSVDFSCLNSFHNCLCCVLGKAGVQSKYFLAEKGSGTAKEKSLCYLDFKHFFYILQRMAEGRGCFNQVKRATLLLRKGDISLLYPCFSWGHERKRQVQTERD